MSEKIEIKIGDETITIEPTEFGLMMSASACHLTAMARKNRANPIMAAIYLKLCDLDMSLCDKTERLIAREVRQ